MESPEKESPLPGRRKARLGGLFKRLALSLGIILAGVILLEVSIRLFDPLGVSHFSDMSRYFTLLCRVTGPPRILKHRPNQRVHFRDFTIRTNSLGLRGPEIPKKKAEGEYRILFLGDSVVLGWGTKEEDLFVTLACKELNARRRGGRTFRCINAGHNMYDTTQEAALLEELGDRLDPDAVILVYVGNDVQLTLKTYQALLEKAQAGKPSSRGFLARTSAWVSDRLRRTFRGITDALALVDFILSMKQAAADKRENPATVDPEGRAASKAAILRIRDWSKARKIPFVVLDHTLPARGERPAEIPFLASFLEREGIPRFPFHFTEEDRKLPIRHSFSDAHANALGHRLLLEKLRPALRFLGLL